MLRTRDDRQAGDMMNDNPRALRPRPPVDRTRSGYGQWWARTPGSAAYLILVFVLAMASLGMLAALFFTGVGLIVLVIGVPVIVASLIVARAFGVADRFLLRLTGLPDIREPDWGVVPRGGGGWWTTLTRPLRNGHYWLSLVHGMIVNPIIATLSFAVTVTWLALSLGGLTYAFWGVFVDRLGDGSRWGRYVSEGLPWLFGGWDPFLVQLVLYLVAGVVAAVTLPWVVGGLARGHHAVATAMLGRWTSDDSAAEARAEAAARTAAAQAEDASLRRLERDIHDGPQQRLVRLQLDLAAIQRRAEAGDTQAAASLAREAHGHAQSALDELRALSSGVAPPLLQDRGLLAALDALASANALPVTATLDPTLDAAVSPARAVYFLVAELLTNTVKHSGATTVALMAGVIGSPRPGIEVSVSDDGREGAFIDPGHGLAGLRDRVDGLRGSMMVDSPRGGPTRVTIHIPPSTGA